MSKQMLACLLVSILFVVAGGYYIFTKKSVEDLTAKENLSILLYVQSGDVSYKVPGKEFQKATSSPIIISSGTLIYTGIGRASVLFPNNSSIDLDNDTELTVNYNDTKISLYQTLGTTYHRVEALVTGATYEVETPGTLAAVRGTKFAVKYDKLTKATKIAVTEHRVEVSKIKIHDASSTRSIIETVLLEEGKTARVSLNVVATTSTSSIMLMETEKDPEMKIWVDKNILRDQLEQSIKEKSSNKEDQRMEIKTLLRDGTKEEIKLDTSNEDRQKKEDTQKTIQSDKKEEERVANKPDTTKRDEAKETKAESKQDSEATRAGAAVAVKKIDEEVFFDKFNALFIDNFYLDEGDTPCKLQVTPEERTRVVTSYAAVSGYGFTSKTLLSYATAINAYCLNKTPEIKTQLQGRFDVEFPFNE